MTKRNFLFFSTGIALSIAIGKYIHLALESNLPLPQDALENFRKLTSISNHPITLELAKEKWHQKGLPWPPQRASLAAIAAASAKDLATESVVEVNGWLISETELITWVFAGS